MNKTGRELVALCVECKRPVLPLSERCGPHHINWVSKMSYKEYQKRYKQTDAYKESQKRYQQTDAYKESQKRYYLKKKKELI